MEFEPNKYTHRAKKIEDIDRGILLVVQGVLNVDPSASVSGIAYWSGLSKQLVSYRLDRLAKMGLVKPNNGKDSKDKRNYTLTPAAQSLLEINLIQMNMAFLALLQVRK